MCLLRLYPACFVPPDATCSQHCTVCRRGLQVQFQLISETPKAALPQRLNEQGPMRDLHKMLLDDAQHNLPFSRRFKKRCCPDAEQTPQQVLLMRLLQCCCLSLCHELHLAADATPVSPHLKSVSEVCDRRTPCFSALQFVRLQARPRNRSAVQSRPAPGSQAQPSTGGRPRAPTYISTDLSP